MQLTHQRQACDDKRGGRETWQWSLTSKIGSSPAIAVEIAGRGALDSSTAAADARLPESPAVSNIGRSSMFRPLLAPSSAHGRSGLRCQAPRRTLATSPAREGG
jgi:hypothetical protein